MNKKKLNKRAVVIVSFYDILAMLLFVIIMLFWMMVLSPPQRQAIEIRDQIHYFDDEDMLIAILKMPVLNKTVLDFIYEENVEIVFDAINRSLVPVFGPVCFQLKVDDKKFTDLKCKQILKEELLMSEIYVPKDKEEMMKIELVVPGYAE